MRTGPAHDGLRLTARRPSNMIPKIGACGREVDVALLDVPKAALLLALALAAVAPAAAIEGENLLAPMPDDFKVGYHDANDSEAMAEYVPDAETVDNWSRMVTVQIFHKLKGADADVFAGNLAKGWRGACPGGDGRKLTSGVENGYAFSLWAFECPLNPETGKPETMWLKATSGADSLYGVQYAYRSAANEARAAAALSYLKAVSVCDKRHIERPCPAGM